MYTHQVVIDVAFKQFLVMPEWMEVSACIYMWICAYVPAQSLVMPEWMEARTAVTRHSLVVNS